MTEIKRHSSAQWVIVLSYSLVIMALYFEQYAGVAFVAFLISMGWLGFKAFKMPAEQKTPLLKQQRQWIVVSLIYAGVLIASFFHFPITDDGVWRLSSYAFILLLTGMFFIQTKYQITPVMLFSVAFFSFVYALIVFIIEWNFYGNALFLGGVRLGHYAAIDTGGYANFVMATLIFMVAVIALQGSRYLRFAALVALALLFVFAILTKGRTNIFFIPFIVLLAVFFLIHNKLWQLKSKLTLISLPVLFIAIAGTTYFGKDRMYSAVSDFQQLEQDNYYTSMGLRVLMAKVGTQIVQENPVMGVGLNHFRDAKADVLERKFVEVPEFVRNQVVDFTQIHNQFLMDAIFAGVFGLIALMLFLGYPLWLYARYYFQSDDVDVRIVAMSGIAFMGYILFTSLFGTVFTYTYTTIMYMLINMMLLGYLTQANTKQTSGV